MADPIVGVRMEPELKARIIRVAAQREQTPSGFVRWACLYVLAREDRQQSKPKSATRKRKSA